MRSRMFGSKGSLFFGIVILVTLSAAAPVSNRNDPSLQFAQSTKAIQRLNPNSMEKRYPSQYLGAGWVLYYQAFYTFGNSIRVASALSQLWTEIALTITRQPDAAFTGPILATHLMLGQEYGLGLQLEVFNMSGNPVTREFMLVVTRTMIDYTSRGFCGLFNARLTRSSEPAIWITLRMTGAQALRAAIDRGFAGGSILIGSN